MSAVSAMRAFGSTMAVGWMGMASLGAKSGTGTTVHDGQSDRRRVSGLGTVEPVPDSGQSSLGRRGHFVLVGQLAHHNGLGDDVAVDRRAARHFGHRCLALED